MLTGRWGVVESRRREKEEEGESATDRDAHGQEDDVAGLQRKGRIDGSGRRQPAPAMLLRRRIMPSRGWAAGLEVGFGVSGHLVHQE